MSSGILAGGKNTNDARYAFDNIGAVFFGKKFGFVENSIDYGDYIKSVHTALRLLSAVSMAPIWIRNPLLIMGIMVPKVFKAIKAAENIRQTAVDETSIAQERSLGANSKKTDILSQLLSIVQQKENMTIREVHGDIWAAV